MDISAWNHGTHINLHPDWKERLTTLVQSKEESPVNLRDYADHLLRDKWREPALSRAMLVTSVALWLTEGLGLILLRSTLDDIGENARDILRRVLHEWMAPDTLTVQIVSYDTPLREAVESILYEQDRGLYTNCHRVMEREVNGYSGEQLVREATEISKAYHVSALNATAGMERYCNLYKRGTERHQPNLLRRVSGLSSVQRKRHFGARDFDRFFLFFEGFEAYTKGERARGLTLLEAIVSADGAQGPQDFPAQVAFHLVGNACLGGRHPDVPRALKLVANAVEIARKHRDSGAMAQTLTTLGRTYIKLEKYNEAVAALREAVELARDSDRSSLTFPLCELATAALQLGRNSEARAAAEEVIKLEGHPKTKRIEIERAKEVLVATT